MYRLFVQLLQLSVDLVSSLSNSVSCFDGDGGGNGRSIRVVVVVGGGGNGDGGGGGGGGSGGFPFVLNSPGVTANRDAAVAKLARRRQR